MFLGYGGILSLVLHEHVQFVKIHQAIDFSCVHFSLLHAPIRVLVSIDTQILGNCQGSYYYVSIL